MTDPSAPKSAFSAFISYRRSDESFAHALEKALERYTPPKGLDVPPGHLNVFRDKEDLTGTEYHQAIQKYLDLSAKLIVLCSPAARSSPNVDEEIRRFARTRGPEDIVPVLISGLPNNEATPEQENQKAFPEALCELMATPLAVDYRGFDRAKDSPDKGRFEGAWYGLLANLYGVGRGDLEERDRRRQQRARRVRAQIAGAVGIALLGLTLWALASRQEAVSRQLAANSLAQLPIDPELSVLLAAEAIRTRETVEAEEALRRALARSHVRRVLHEHEGWVNDVGFSAGGTMLVSASDDKTARIWDVASGGVLYSLWHEEGIVRSAAFAPKDDARVLTATNKKVRVWDAKTGALVLETPGSYGAFSPDAKLIVAIVADSLAVIEVATGNRVWAPAATRPACASFSPDGRQILVCVGSEAQVWQLGAARPTHRFQHDQHQGLSHAAFSADGRRIVTVQHLKEGEGSAVKEWELASGKSWPLTEDRHQVLWAGFANDESRTVATVSGKVVRLRTTEEGEVQARGHTDWVNSAEFSPDGHYLVTASQDGSARVWETKTGLVVASLLGHTDTVVRARFSPDGRFVASASADGSVRVWEVVPAVVLQGHSDWVTSAAFDREGQRVVTTSWDKTARIWNAHTGKVMTTIQPRSGGLNKAAFSPDGRFVVLAGGTPSARVWDLAAGSEQATLVGHKSELFTAAYSDDGSRIVTAGGADGMAKVWDAQTGREELTLSPHEGLVTSARFSPDGESVLTTGADRTARITHLGSNRFVKLEGHTGMVWTGAFSADGKLVVTGSSDMTARIWDARSGRQLAVLKGHTSRVTAAAFRPDAALVVTASADKTVRVWGAKTGRVHEVLDHHTDLVSSVSFAPDGKHLLTSSDDGAAVIVDCALCDSTIPELTVLARSRVTRDLPPEQQNRLARLLNMLGL